MASSAAIAPQPKKLEHGNEIQRRGNADKNNTYLGCNIRFIVSVSVGVVVMLVMATHVEILMGCVLYRWQRGAVAGEQHTFFNL